MNKKVIITLLSATATGVAFANVDLNGQVGDWSFTGVPGAGSEIGKLDLLVPNLNGGVASQTISNLPQGKYILSWDAATAVNVVVNANGTEVTNGTAFDFAGGNLEITIGPDSQTVNTGGYTIKNISLEIDCKPVTFRRDLLAAIDAAGESFTALNANVTDEVVIARFASRKEAIEDELSALKSKVNLLPFSDDNVSLGKYKTYELWDLTTENKLYTGEGGLNAIKEEIETYNGDADLVNAKADYVVKAKDAAEAAKADAAAIDTTNLTDLLDSADENEQSEWIMEQVAADYQALANEQEVLSKTIEDLAAAKCDNAATLEAVAEADAELDTQIADVNAAVAKYAADVTALEGAINDAIATADNYNKIWVADGTADVPSVNYLNEEVNKARKQLFQLAGVYVPIQQKANIEIDNIVKKAMADLTIVEGEVGTATSDNFTADQTTLKNAIADIQAAVQDALDTLDGPYGKVAAQIEALNNSIDSTDGTRPSDAADLAAEKTVIDAKLAALQSDAEAALADGTITETMFESEIKGIDDLIGTYNRHIAASIQDVANYNANNDLLNSYLTGEDGLTTVWQSWIATEEEEISDHKSWWITENSKFQASYNDVKDFINKQIAANDELYATTDDIPVLTDSDDAIKTIKASVEGFSETGNLIIDEILAVAAKVKTYGGYADEIQTVLDKKDAYATGAKAPYQTTIDNINGSLEKMDNALAAAVAIQDNGQKVYEGVKAINENEDYKDATFQAAINGVLTDLEVGITTSNQAFVANALATADGKITAADGAPGKANIKDIISGFTTEVNGVVIPNVDANVTANADVATFAGTYADADAAIAAVKAYLDDINKAVTACNTNATNYNANTLAIAGIQISLDALDTTAQEYDAYEKAYKALIAAEQAKIGGLTSDNNTAYNAFDVTKTEITETQEDGTEVGTGKYNINIGTRVANGLTDPTIDSVKTSIADTKTAINNNEDYYQTLVNLSIDNGIKLSGYVDVINAHINAGSVEAPNLAKQMQAILTQLYNYNGDIYEAYTKMFEGEGFEYATVEGKILGWVEEADAIMAQLNNDVVQYNNALFNSAWANNTDSGYKAVYGTYTASVLDFDSYKSITNEGFLAYEYEAGKTVEDLLSTTHASLFVYYDLIRQLNKDAEALRNKLNGSYNEADGADYANIGVTITDQFDLGTPVVTEDEHTVSGFLTLAAKYNTEIETILNDFTTTINNAAQAYYTQESTAKAALLDNAKTNLTDVGISEAAAETALTELQGYYDAAVDAYDTATDVENPTPLAKSMNEICGNLDKITDDSIADVTEPAALAEWTTVYNDATVDAMIDFSDCPGIDITSYTAEYNVLKGLNDEAYADYADNNLLANLNDLKTRLAAAAAAAKAEGESLKAAWNAEHADTVLYESFMGAGMDNLNELYDGLSNFVLPLAAAPEELDVLDNIKAQIDQLKADVEAAGEGGVKTVLGEVASYTESSRYQNIVNAIDAEYVQAYNNEIDFLQSNVDAVKAGFNTAVANGKVDEGQADTYWDGINDLSTEIGALVDATTAAEAQEGIDKVNTLQESLARYQVLVDGFMGVNTLQDVIDALNDAAGKVADQISELQLNLDDCEQSVQDEYSAKIGELEAELEAVKAQITNDPATIYQQANIENQLGIVSNNIAAVAGDVEAAEAAARAQIDLENENQEIYNALIDDLANITSDAELLQQDSEFFGYSATSVINRANGWVTFYTDELDVEKANNEIPANGWTKTSLNDFVNGQCTQINTRRANGAYSQTYYLFNDANNAVNNAVLAISNYNDKYPSQTGRFEGELADIVSALAVLTAPETMVVNNETQTGEVTEYVDGLKDIYNQAKAICIAANDLTALISLNDVKLGDVNLNNDVNISDVVKLLNLILNNTPYDENEKSHIAADINGNKKLDTSDIQSILNIIYDSPAKAVTMQRMAPKPANITVAAERMAIAGDAQSFAINMSTDTQLVGGMVDIILADGMQITSIMPTDRLEGLDFYTNDLGNGVTRVVFICTSETHTISGTDGAIFNVEVNGTGNIGMDNVEFTNAQAHLYTIGAVSSPSGIETIWSEVKAFGRRVYNVSGQMMNRLQRGINIITNSDGTTSKVLKK